MILFVAEKHNGTKWYPITFWIGAFRFGLLSHPDCRIRRVNSREEADRLAEFILPRVGFLDFDWSQANEYEWSWPLKKDLK